MTDVLDPIREALHAAGRNPPRGMRLAVVTSLTGGISVQFDEEGTPSSRKYKVVGGAGAIHLGDRVLMARAGSTYVVLGGIWDQPIDNYVASAAVSTATIGNAGFVTLNIPKQVDPMNMYNPANGIYTIQKSGVYDLYGSIYWNPRAAPATHLLLVVQLNGGEYMRWSSYGGVAASGQGCGGIWSAGLGAGTTVNFAAYQDGGSTISSGNISHAVRMIRVA